MSTLKNMNLVDIRHKLHTIPEIGLAEHKTASLLPLSAERMGAFRHKQCSGRKGPAIL